MTGIFAASLGVAPEVRAEQAAHGPGFFALHRHDMPIGTKTLQLRIKDKHAKVLRQMAREVNQVWNHVNEVSVKAARPFHGKPKYLSGYDLQKCTVKAASATM